MNKHLLHDLTEMGLWSPVLKNKIINENGSVSKIPKIPEQLKAIYKYGYLHLVYILYLVAYLYLFMPRQNYFVIPGLCGKSSKRHWLTWLLIVDAT
jgi:hypothetical protein